MTPALTAEEWAAYFVQKAREIERGDDEDPGWGYPSIQLAGRMRLVDRHIEAACCLHGQPFGFSRDDVSALRHFYGFLTRSLDYPDGSFGHKINNLADRIEALLPPEGE